MIPKSGNRFSEKIMLKEIKPTMTDQSRDAAGLYAQARALAPALRQRSAQTVANRMVPAETIAEFQRAGFFRVLQPKRFGGLQMDFPVFANLVRELAHGCGSSA